MMLGAAPRALTAGSASVIGVTDSPASGGGRASGELSKVFEKENEKRILSFKEDNADYFI